MSHHPENLLTVWADALLRALADAGVREVVASPGSRSTPFLLAALREPRLHVRSVIDERAAGFFALGIARASGRAPLLLCTSGSAPAHYYPAVIEASEAALPLLVLSADRPRELARAGAPQTTDQQRLFGVHARAFADLGEPHPSEGALRGMRRTAAELVARALGPEPGPVQINAPARKPLEPLEAHSEAGVALRERVEALPACARVEPSHRALDHAAIEEVARAIGEAERPAIVAGPLARRCAQLVSLAREASIALLAEAASQLRFTARDGVIAADGFGHWIEHTSPGPDLVLEIGATPTSGEYARWLATTGPRRRYVLGGSRFRDPSGRARRVILGDLSAIVARLRERARAGSRPEWAQILAEREQRAWAATERVLDETAFSEVHAVRAAIAATPAAAQIALGNSLPIRTVDRFVPGGRSVARVLSARGVNGIDGWIAGAAGAAAADGSATLALIGDVTAAHDIGALQLAAATTAPLAIVVIDNRGGRIFEELPIAEVIDEATLSRFTTPPRIDFAAACSAFGVRYARAQSGEATGRAVQDALSNPGATLVHVEVAERGAGETLRRVRREMA